MLSEAIWDELAAARGLKVELAERTPDGGLRYTVSMLIDVDAVHAKFLATRAHSADATLRRIVRRGLRLFFADDDTTRNSQR